MESYVPNETLGPAIANKQYVSKIFSYLPIMKLIRLQILNKRMYDSIIPHSMSTMLL